MSTAFMSRRITGPQFEMKMSAVDSSYGGFYSRRILVFRTTQPPDRISDVLEQGLRHLVRLLPTLAGEGRMAENDDNPLKQKGWRTIVPGSGVHLQFKNLQDTIRYDDLEASNFAPEMLPDATLMPVPPTGRAEPFDVAEIQVNFIDGGVLLAICFSHIAGDGTAMTEIIRLLAESCKLVQSGLRLDPLARPIGIDRTPMLGLRTSDGKWAAEDHKAREILSPDQKPQFETHLPAVVQKIYRISPSKLSKLKADATTPALPISTNDAIVSIMWRAIMVNHIASKVIEGHSGMTDCYLSVDTRGALQLDPRYIGNSFAFRVVQVSIQEAIGEHSLEKLAAAHRSEVNHARKRETAAGYFMMAEAAPSISQWSGSVFSTMGSSSAVITSFFRSESLLTSDWGVVFGHRAQRLRCSDSGFAGIFKPVHFVLPKRPDESAEFQLAVYAEGLDSMEKDDVFARYIDL